MRRTSLCTLLTLLLLPCCAVMADDSNKSTEKNKHHCHGMITKVDTAKHAITVKTTDSKDKNATPQEKTFTLADDAKIMDATGHDEKMDGLKSGDSVCITEKDGKAIKVREHAEAKITKVDQKAGTVTVTTKDKNGKDVDKTFRLVEETEYLDSAGRIALLDTFRSGDDVLFLEADGRLEAMKKQDDKNKKSDGKGSPSSSNNK